MSQVKEEFKYDWKGKWIVLLNMSFLQTNIMLQLDLARFNRVVGKRMILLYDMKPNSKCRKVPINQVDMINQYNCKLSNKTDIIKRKLTINNGSLRPFSNRRVQGFKITHKSKISLDGKLNGKNKIQPSQLAQEHLAKMIKHKNSKMARTYPKKYFSRIQYLKPLKAVSTSTYDNQITVMILKSRTNSEDFISSASAIDTNFLNFLNEEELIMSNIKETDKPFISYIDPLASSETLIEILSNYSTNKPPVHFRGLLNESFLKRICSSYDLSALIGIYNSLKKKELSDLFLSLINFLGIALTIDCNSLLEFLSLIIETVKDADLIYSLFNAQQTWEMLISSKYGKCLVEYFMKEHYTDNPSKHSILFSLIDQNFLEYSLQNYTTFVVQVYVSYYAQESAFKRIIKNFDQLCLCRNGVFVIMAGLKGYKNMKLQLLLDKIINNSEYLCNEKYASTMIEYVFKTFGSKVSQSFIDNKLTFLYGKQIS